MGFLVGHNNFPNTKVASEKVDTSTVRTLADTAGPHSRGSIKGNRASLSPSVARALFHRFDSPETGTKV